MSTISPTNRFGGLLIPIPIKKSVDDKSTAFSLAFPAAFSVEEPRRRSPYFGERLALDVPASDYFEQLASHHQRKRKRLPFLGKLLATLVFILYPVVGSKIPVMLPPSLSHAAQPGFDNVTDPALRAHLAWDALVGEYGKPGDLMAETQRDSFPFFDEAFYEHPCQSVLMYQSASVWAYGQALQAALDIARNTGDYRDFEAMAKRLDNYRDPEGGYAPVTNGTYGISSVTGPSKMLYDDIAWLGLVFIQAYQQTGYHNDGYLKKATEIFEELQTGQLPDGSLLWQKNAGDDARVIVTSMGPAMELALQLHMVMSSDWRNTNTPYFQFAKRISDFLHKPGNPLLLDNGLWGDYIHLASGERDPSIYSYNQGTLIGSDVLFYLTTQDPSYLERAQTLARTAMDYFDEQKRFWKQPGIFNAIFIRNLQLLDSVAPDPRIPDFIQAYSNAAWKNGRDPETGLFRPVDGDSSIGTYEQKINRSDLLDQAGQAQIDALIASVRQGLPLFDFQRAILVASPAQIALKEQLKEQVNDQPSQPPPIGHIDPKAPNRGPEALAPCS